MAILAFQKPDKVVMLEATDFHGKFEFRPLEPGYGITVGQRIEKNITIITRRICYFIQ